MLAYTNAFIDSVQDQKSKVLNTIVTDKTISSPLQAMIDAQTEYTKAVCKSFWDLAEAATKFDAAKLFKTA
jgi:hypothetical protein